MRRYLAERGVEPVDTPFRQRLDFQFVRRSHQILNIMRNKALEGGRAVTNAYRIQSYIPRILS